MIICDTLWSCSSISGYYYRILFPIAKNVHLIREHINTDIDRYIIEDMHDLAIFIDQAIVDAVYAERIVPDAPFIAKRKVGVYIIAI